MRARRGGRETVMARAIKDGGPAFPIVKPGLAYQNGLELPYVEEYGLSLRDYFAAKALPAVIAARMALTDSRTFAPDLNQESMAEECYELADALIEARTKEREDA